MEHRAHQVELWEEKVVIPTYGCGVPDRNPMFLEKRVYQGSSGKVYPLPVIDKILDEKEDKAYTAVFLENDYLRVMVLPELGGRIQRALDKTNNYDFVYYNEVIKPALVGLTGPWISGGIEFNWPQHHRPTTFAPVDYALFENADGSKTLRMSEVDQMYGTKGEMCLTLHPDRAYIEIKGQLYNRTNLPQTFLWWANPAVAVNDHTQSVFPPDVHAVFDHGKRDVSAFPIATGVYYKHDYGAGVDISRYKNIPVPTSYMCARSEYNFVGGYDYALNAGILHVADHHISPGKKQWTWGCGDFGQVWDRNLTDANGPYIELMTGVFTDNQPDFSWLKPFEEKTFTQYFLPYKRAAYVKNASREVLLNLEATEDGVWLAVYATAVYEGARVTLARGSEILYAWTGTLSPEDVLEAAVTTDADETELELSVYDARGRRMLSYHPRPRKIERVPEPMTPARPPEEIATNEELYLNGLHIEQYRHATYLPDPYYLEGLKRDPGDIRINNAYGTLLLRRGQFTESEKYFRAAIARMTGRNPNPYDSEAYYNLGLSLLYQGRDAEAYDAFYKATWTSAQQEMAFYYLAALVSKDARFDEALEHIERSLVKNGHNLKARALRARLLVKLGRMGEAIRELEENLKVDAFDYNSRLLLHELTGTGLEETLRMMGNRASSFIECAIDCAEAGFLADAVKILRRCTDSSPMLKYYEAYYTELSGGDALPLYREAAARDSRYCLPNRLEDIAVLARAADRSDDDGSAPYYLGCLLYDSRRYEDAIAQWERGAAREPHFPTVWRNLSLAYFNKRGDWKRALECMERAFELDPTDARVLLELDQLHRKLNVPVEERFAFLDAHREAVLSRDDLTVEYVTLLNLLGRYEDALRLMLTRRFHPWEGGEGKVTTQYALSLTQLARRALRAGDAARAKELLERALRFPVNLGEGKLEGAKDNNIYYYLGLAERALGNRAAGDALLERAAQGDEEPAGMMYYNDQPADMILYQGLAWRALGNEERARTRFHKLISYGEKHYYDQVKIDYFAVSLPDLQLFDEDLSVRNRAHCEYLIALGSYGLGETVRAERSYAAVLDIDCAHVGARVHRRLLTECD